MTMALIIAGERSGVGKTTITLAILTHLCDRVQSFKVGPDYIDPMFHNYVTGRPCRNLDPVLTSEAYVQQCFTQHSQTADYSVVEGVMGLFDGASGTDDIASTAHIARLLNTPVVLVVDCSRLSRSAAAIIHGYKTFDSRIHIAGVILNRVGSDRHLQLLTTAIEPLDVPILGIFKRETQITIPDRHLGLVPTDELPALDAVIDKLRAIATTSVDWDRLLPLLRSCPLSPESLGLESSVQPTPAPTSPVSSGLLSSEASLSEPLGFLSSTQPTRPESAASLASLETQRELRPRHSASSAVEVRIAIARDRAFNFYYADNLDSLEHLGATLVDWSPLNDAELPEGIHGLYLGGGFPEVFGTELSANQSAQRSVHQAITAGLPTYAECGGLMYLCEAIVDFEGHHYPMVGILPTTVRMGKRLSLGYRRAIAQHTTPLTVPGQTLWGHEFHRSQLDNPPPFPIYTLQGYESPIHPSTDGWHRFNLHASYLHLHWGTQPDLPKRFLKHCYDCISADRSNLKAKPQK